MYQNYEAKARWGVDVHVRLLWKMTDCNYFCGGGIMNAIKMCNNVIVKNIKLILLECVIILMGYWLYTLFHKNLILIVVGLFVVFLYIAFNKSAYEIVQGNDVEIKKILEYCKKSLVRFIFVAIMFIVCFFSLVICVVLILINSKGLGLVLAVPLVLFVIIAVHLTMTELCISQGNISIVIKNVCSKVKKNIIACLLYGIAYIAIFGIVYFVYSIALINIAVVIGIVLVVYVNVLFSVVYFNM